MLAPQGRDSCRLSRICERAARVLDLGTEEAGQCAFVCDGGVLLTCGRSRHVKLLDSESCGAFSSPLPVFIRLVGCRLFALGKRYEFWR